MPIATLPPQNHINALRAFMQHMRRTRSMPNAKDLADAEEHLQALQDAVRLPTSPEKASMPASDDIINQREEEW